MYSQISSLLVVGCMLVLQFLRLSMAESHGFVLEEDHYVV